MAGITENPNLHLLNLLREHGKRLVAIEQQQNMVFTDPTDTVGDPANNYAFLVIGYLGNIVGASLTGYGVAIWGASAWEQVATAFLPLAGGAMTGAIAMGANKITGLANGSAAQDAAAYGQISGLLGFATPAAFKPGNPTASSTTTPGVMMGLGTTIQFTPTKTGIVQITLTGIAGTNTGLVGFGITPKYGLVSGGVPANQAAPSGTNWGVGTSAAVEATAAGTRSFVIYQDRIPGPLTLNVAYWFDVALFTANASDAAVLADVTCLINETN